MTAIHRWDLKAAGEPIKWPKPVTDRGLPKAKYRDAKWQLRRNVTRWLVRTGLRTMNAHYAHYGDEEAARHAVGYWELKEAALVADGGRYLATTQSEDGRYILLDDYELGKSVQRALRTLERTWTPDFIETASLAGRISMRPPTYTAADYLRVEGLPQRLAAEVLGCSVRTIKRLAAKARAAGNAIRATLEAVSTRVVRLTPWLKSRGQITRAGVVPGPAKSGTLGPSAGPGESPGLLSLGGRAARWDTRA